MSEQYTYGPADQLTCEIIDQLALDLRCERHTVIARAINLLQHAVEAERYGDRIAIVSPDTKGVAMLIIRKGNA